MEIIFPDRKKSVNELMCLRLWCLGLSNRFLIGENLRKQTLSKNFNAAYSRKREPNL